MNWLRPIFPLFFPMVATLVSILGFIQPDLSQAQESAADVVTAEASLAYDDGNLEEALVLLNQALELYPDHAEALYFLGLIYLKQEKLDESLAALQKAHELVPKSPSVTFQLGVVHFNREEYDEAEPLLTAVFEELPTTNNAGYYVGFLRYRKNDYEGAINAFKVGASDDSRILQLTRFYSGLALVQLGLPQQAAEELEMAMRLRTVSPLIGPADRLRDTLTAAQKTDHKLTGQVRVGGFYDTNVAVVPLETNAPTIRSSRNRKTNSPGILSSLRLDYALPSLGPVQTTIGYSLFHISNNDVANLNLLNHLGSLGAFYGTSVATMPAQIGLQLSTDNTELGDDQFLRRYSALLFATLVESARHLTTLQGGAQIKEFEDTDVSQFAEPARTAFAADTQSGTNWMAGIAHTIRFDGGRHFIRGGFQFDTDAALGNNFDYQGYRIQAGGMNSLPWWSIRIRYDYDLYFRIYENPNTLLTRTGQLLPFGMSPVVRQRVTEHNHVLRFEKPLPYDMTVAVEWQGTFSRSNTDSLFNFNRQLITGSVAWAFSHF